METSGQLHAPAAFPQEHLISNRRDSILSAPKKNYVNKFGNVHSRGEYILSDVFLLFCISHWSRCQFIYCGYKFIIAKIMTMHPETVIISLNIHLEKYLNTIT
jgi:hypothetical protein